MAACALRVPRSFLAEAEARCGPEVECVALLFGGGCAVEWWKWVRNALNSPHAFAVDPEELYAALVEGEGRGLELAAVFHTHAGPPVPSAADLKGMAEWRVVWVIADARTWRVAAWRLEGGAPVEVALELA